MLLEKRREKDILARKRQEERQERFCELEERVYERATGIVEAALSFSEIAFNQAEPPTAWIEELGREGAAQKLAVAKAGWMPQMQAPMAVKLAAQVMTGITRGRASRGGGKASNINVQIIKLPAPTSKEFPEKEEYAVKELDM